MNYDTYDCRISIKPAQAAKALRRKPIKKCKSARGTGRLIAAIRAVTAIGAAVFAFTSVADAQISIQPLTEATSKESKIYDSLSTMSLQSNISVTSADIGAHFLALLQFDLSTIPYSSAQITSATITLYTPGFGALGNGSTGGGGDVTFSPMLNDWRETSGDPGTAPLSTYAAFFGTTPTLTFGPAAATQNVTTPGFVTWDVTNVVKDWVAGNQPNYGFLIQTASANTDIGFADVDSHPGVAGSAPSLTVVPEPGSALLAVSGAAILMARRRRNAR